MGAGPVGVLALPSHIFGVCGLGFSHVEGLASGMWVFSFGFVSTHHTTVGFLARAFRLWASEFGFRVVGTRKIRFRYYKKRILEIDYKKRILEIGSELDHFQHGRQLYFTERIHQLV